MRKFSHTPEPTARRFRQYEPDREARAASFLLNYVLLDWARMSGRVRT